MVGVWDVQVGKAVGGAGDYKYGDFGVDVAAEGFLLGAVDMMAWKLIVI